MLRTYGFPKPHMGIVSKVALLLSYDARAHTPPWKMLGGASRPGRCTWLAFGIKTGFQELGVTWRDS